MKRTDYTDKRFGVMTFNPVCDEPMLERYPKLNEIVDEPWLEDDALDSLLRYTVLMYDPASPIVEEESDLNHRMQAAIEISGIDNTDLIDQLETYTHGFVPELVYNYLKRFAKSKEFALYSAMEYKFWEAIRMTMTPIYGDNSKQQLEGVQKKQIVADELEKDIKRLENYRREFFGDDSLDKEVKKRLTPERMAGLK
jgi:hypothetical protein